jgi:hypothetical protein
MDHRDYTARAVHKPKWPRQGASVARRRPELSHRAWFDPDEQGHLEPLPVAVDVVEAGLAHPPELCRDVEQSIRWILVLEPLADRREECLVQAARRRCDVVEVGEHTPGTSSSMTSASNTRLRSCWR